MDIEHIRSNIIPLLDDGKDVVVVVHSWGGLIGSTAMEGLRTEDRREAGKKGGVSAMVFLTSRLVKKGQTMSEAGRAANAGRKAGPVASARVEGDYSIISGDAARDLFYHDVPKDIADKAVAALGKHQSWPTFTTPLQYEAYKYIPVTYLLCKQDKAIPYEQQQATIREAGITPTTFECDTAHSPFLVQPEFVSRVIRHGAGETSQGKDWVYAGLVA